MSNTPQTDASAFDAEANGIIYKVVFAAFASQLERERNSLQDQRDFAMGEIARLKQERDEARELVKVYKEYAQLLGDELNETVGLAYVHGWRSPRFEQGQVLREKIKQLEAAK